ncbi:MAG: amidinotransferase [bacterium]|nr:amidinotransferase [bacterium]
MITHALCRRPGPDMAGGLTTAGLGLPDPELALHQHSAYVAALKALGLDVDVLPALAGHPDACFVEDTAVLVPDLAVVTRPGAPSRQGEQESVAQALAGPVTRLTEPATLDGGDVLVAERTCWIGLSGRTNADGALQLAAALRPLGYDCITVEVGAGLHLKSGMNHLGGRRLLATPDLARNPAFTGWEVLVVPEDESYAANTLLVNGTLLTPAGFPCTRALIDTCGLPVRELELSEFEKVDGGLTCLSLRF